MFKKVLLSIAVAGALTACSKNETISTNPNPEGLDYISFSPSVPKATRGGITDKNTMEKDANGFYVVAYGDGAFYFNRQLAKPGTKVIKETEQTGFFLDKNYSWPSYELTFAAWYPAKLASGHGSAEAFKSDGTKFETGEYVSQPTWHAAGTGVEAPHTIKNYVPAKEIGNQTDIIIARTIKNPQEPNIKESAVALNFRHILSQISLKAKKDGQDLKVEIRSVALRNIPSKGTFKFRADDAPGYTTDGNVTGSTSNPTLIPLDNWKIEAPDPATSNLTYSDKEGNNVNLQRYDYVLSEPVVLDGTDDVVKDLLDNDQWLLIPQDFNKNNYYGKINYTWAENGTTEGAYLAFEMCVSRKKLNADNEFIGWTQIFPEPGAKRKEKDGITTTVEDGDFGWGAIGLLKTAKWEPGIHYTYTLHFTDEGVGKYDPEEWEEGGDDILGNYIWFTVTVDEWIPTDPADTDVKL